MKKQKPSVALFQILLLLTIVLIQSSAFAAVILQASGGNLTATSSTAVQGSTFTFTISLNSTSEQTTGLDYYLQSSSVIASGFFTIQDRNITGSSYSDLFVVDSTVELAPNSTLLLPRSGAVLPRNGSDLGAGLANVNSPLGIGTFFVASYTMLISPGATPGIYTLQTVSLPGEGYIANSANSFDSVPFNQQATFNVTVTAAAPEPTSAALLMVGVVSLATRRRRAAKV